MNTCEIIQGHLFHHLYGLLDDPDRQAVTEHLQTCAACQAALNTAQGQQQLLAVAARTEFPEVRFTPPPVEVVAAPRPEIVRLAPVRAAAGLPIWSRWAIAAGVLAAVGLVSIPIGTSIAGLRREVAQAQDDKDQKQRRRDDLEKARRDEEQRVQKEVRDVQEEIKKLDTERKRKRLQVKVTGPETIQAGARNYFLIHTQNLANEPVPSEVDVRLRNQTNQQVVFEKRGLRTVRGQCGVLLPPDLPQKPGTRFALEVAARGDNGSQITDVPRLELVAPLYLTHLTTDKPMYQPGEVVHFRSLTLERFSLKPVTPPLTIIFRVTDPLGTEVFHAEGGNALHFGPEKGNGPVLGPNGNLVTGVGAGSYAIPAGAAGGVYTLSVTVTDRSDRPSLHQEQRRQFIVNRYEKPRFNKDLEFTRKSYGPGDDVVAVCKVARAEGGKPLVDQEIRATVQVDGKTFTAAGREAAGDTPGIILRTDAQGAALVRFRLPPAIEVGEASLALRFTDGQNHETLVRPIPIVLKKLTVEFFPEGGDLVAGVPNRVYFQVRTPQGKPAELKARILDGRDNVVARIETLNDDKNPGANQGMGVFTLAAPQAGMEYRLAVDSPAGIEGRHPLPKVKADGVVLSIPGGVLTDNIGVQLHNGPRERKLLVGAYCRGRLLDHQTVTIQAGGQAQLNLKPQAGVGGVYRVTVFEERDGKKATLKPVAERLVYRQPAGKVNLALKPDRGRYAPREPVKLNLTAADEHDRPVPAILLISVVDKSVLTLADEKTARTMPTHFYLMTEVRGSEDLEHADFLLDDSPLGGRALDLLLGTQGWRRFAEQQDPAAFEKEQPKRLKKDAERLVLATGRTNYPKAHFAQPEVRPQGDEFQPRINELTAKANNLQQIHWRTNGERMNKVQQADVFLRHARVAALDAEDRLDDYWQTVRLVGLIVLIMILGTVGVGALVLVSARMQEEQSSHARSYAIGGTALAGAVLLIGITIYLHTNAAGRPMDPELAQARQQQMWGMDRGGQLGDNKAQGGPRFGGGGEAEGRPMPPMAPEGDMKKGGMDEVKKDAAPVQAARLAQERPADAAAAKNRAAARQAQAAATKDGKQAPNAPAGPVAHVRKPIDLPPRLEMNGRGGRAMKEQAANPMFVVREYAYQAPAARSRVRTDFAETLYWHPVLVLAGGKGEVSFDLCDSVTTFRVLALAHTLDGRLGAAATEIESQLPVTLEPKVPVEVTASDQVTIPLAINNATDRKRSVRVQVETHGLRQTGDADVRLDVEAEKGARRLFHFRPSLAEGQARVLFKGTCEPFAQDSIERTFRVVPDGFPVLGQKSDLLEQSAVHTLTMPRSWIKDSLKLQVQVFPSTLADLQQGLEGLLREPGGCFEQTSTSNYPNVLILNYLQETDQAKPEAVQKARAMLDSGYKKLTSFECQDPADKNRRGYEWFGGTAPPHEALTAYGLLQFRDMARVHPVDQAMMERTRKYLMAQKDGQGGFKRNARAIDTFGGAPEHITNAYIVWALTESGKEDNVDKELAALTKMAEPSKDPYFLALVANSLYNRGKTAAGLALLKKLAKLQKDDGHLDGAETSITRSGGRDLQIETTALTVLAWLKSAQHQFTQELPRAIKWLGQQRGGFGGFGSTQSTILALKALIAYTRANKKTAEAGELILYVNNHEVGRRAFPAGAQDVLTVAVPDAEKVLLPGRANRVRVEITGKNVFPYTLSWSYRTVQPANADRCPVHLTTRLDRAATEEADTVQLTAAVENRSGKDQGMAVAIIGLPGGVTLPEDLKQLKNYLRLRDRDAKPGAVGRYLSAFEVKSRELVLYWRNLAKGEKIEVNLDLICRMPGVYRGPASRAYLYYNADDKFWQEPLAVSIKAREDK
jgi:anti-sigma factor RsiW